MPRSRQFYHVEQKRCPKTCSFLWENRAPAFEPIDDSYVDPFYEEAESRRRAYANIMPQAGVPAPMQKPKAKPQKAEEEIKDAAFADGLLFEKSDGGSSLKDYLKRMDESFREMLIRKIDENGMTDAECYMSILYALQILEFCCTRNMNCKRGFSKPLSLNKCIPYNPAPGDFISWTSAGEPAWQQ